MTDSTGLMVRISPKGIRSFWHVYWLDGKTHRIKLGGYHEDTADGTGITLAAANRRLAEHRDKINRGRDPKGDAAGKPPLPADLTTVRELAERFRSDILSRRVRADEAWRYLEKDVLPAIGDDLAAEVTAYMLATRVLYPIQARGAHTQANKVRIMVKQLFSFAVGRGVVATSPADHLTAATLGFRYRPRVRVLTDDELKAAWQALDVAKRLSLPVRYAVKILVLTGARTGELRDARWADVDLKTGLWVIPRHKTTHEGAKAHDVPLECLTLELFKELRAAAGDSPWVLFSPITGDEDAPRRERIEEKAIGHAVRRLVTATKMDPWTPHDLRRVIRSGMSRLGVPPHICEKVLGHSLGRINDIYDQHSFTVERREALAKWAAHIEALVSTHDEKVVRLRGRAS